MAREALCYVLAAPSKAKPIEGMKSRAHHHLFLVCCRETEEILVFLLQYDFRFMIKREGGYMITIGTSIASSGIVDCARDAASTSKLLCLI